MGRRCSEDGGRCRSGLRVTLAPIHHEEEASCSAAHQEQNQRENQGSVGPRLFRGMALLTLRTRRSAIRSSRRRHKRGCLRNWTARGNRCRSCRRAGCGPLRLGSGKNFLGAKLGRCRRGCGRWRLDLLHGGNGRSRHDGGDRLCRWFRGDHRADRLNHFRLDRNDGSRRSGRWRGANRRGNRRGPDLNHRFDRCRRCRGRSGPGGRTRGQRWNFHDSRAHLAFHARSRDGVGNVAVALPALQAGSDARHGSNPREQGDVRRGRGPAD